MSTEHLRADGHDIYCSSDETEQSLPCDCGKMALVRQDERLRVAKLLLDSVDHE